jgi:hypothetical protein
MAEFERERQDQSSDVEWLSDMIRLLRDPPPASPYSTAPWNQESRDGWIRSFEAERDEIIETMNRRNHER